MKKHLCLGSLSGFSIFLLSPQEERELLLLLSLLHPFLDLHRHRLSHFFLLLLLVCFFFFFLLRLLVCFFFFFLPLSGGRMADFHAKVRKRTAERRKEEEEEERGGVYSFMFSILYLFYVPVSCSLDRGRTSSPSSSPYSL